MNTIEKMEKEKKPKILLLDPLKKGNRDSKFLSEYLEKEGGFIIERPEDLRSFIKSLDLMHSVPDAVLYLHCIEDDFFKDLITALEVFNVPIFNSLSSIRNCSDRLWVKKRLLENNIPTPDFFYGPASNCTVSWKRKILKVRNGEDNLVVLLENRPIHAHDRMIFLEEWIALPKGYIDTIFVVGKDMFQTAKNDSFELYEKKNLHGEFPLDPQLANIAARIGDITELVLYSVDFADGKVIDINPFPNIFWERSFKPIADFLKEKTAREI